MSLDIKNSPYLGLYEHFYDDSVFTDEPNNNGVAVSTHYVVNGFELVLPNDDVSLPKEQHNEYRWLSEEEFKTSDEVHVHSRWYVDKSIGFKSR